MKKIKINRVKLYDTYMEWVNQVADDIPEKTHFNVDEIINAISRILESNTDMIQEFPNEMERHKWSQDVCKRCSLERNKIMNSKGFYNVYYLVNRKWTKEKPMCIPQIPKQDD